jgi:hypothetical protein
MAASAIVSVSGISARLSRESVPGVRTVPPNGEQADRGTEQAVLVDIDEQIKKLHERKSDDNESKTSPTKAILDYDELAARAEKLKRQKTMGGRPLEEMLVITQLQARDTEVRRHEAAHIAAGNGYIIGGASYTYQVGPDGRHYAVGGEVGIDSSSIPGKPEETIRKMRIVRAAALAPAQPSAADFAVAAAAAQAEAAALAELAAARAQELAGRYRTEMAAGKLSNDLGAMFGQVSRTAFSSIFRTDGPPTTPFDVIA